MQEEKRSLREMIATIKEETPGDRLYLIRLACGEGLRKAESLPEFAARVRAKTGAKYDPSTISLLERMKQGWRLEDVKAFAAVDPLKRGEVWLSALAAIHAERPAAARITKVSDGGIPVPRPGAAKVAKKKRA